MCLLCYLIFLIKLLFFQHGNQIENSTKPTSKRKRILEPWTQTQKERALSYFKNHLQKKLPPKKYECVSLKEENPKLFSNKTWEKIKIFVVNSYNKMK